MATKSTTKPETVIETEPEPGVVEQHTEVVGEPTTQTLHVESTGESSSTPEEPAKPTEPAGIVMIALRSHNYLSSPGGYPTALSKGVRFVVQDPDLAKEYEDSGEAARAENAES